MANIAAIKASTILSGTSVTTDAAIGVDSTFDPEGFRLPGVARWVNRTSGIAIGYPAFTMSVRPPTKASRVYKVVAKLDVPTLEITSPSTSSGIQPQPTLAYSCQAHVEFLLPERSTLAERNALLSLLRSFMLTTITASDGSPTDSTASPLVSAVANFEAPY